ncbi:MAG: ComF family protein [Luteitalea sp.]|nr:ComF family protein [Luteitalea sp.]
MTARNGSSSTASTSSSTSSQPRRGRSIGSSVSGEVPPASTLATPAPCPPERPPSVPPACRERSRVKKGTGPFFTASSLKKGPVPFFARRAIDGLLAVLLAPRCASCEELLDSPTSGVVCPRCWSALVVFTPPVCERCGLPVLRTGSCGPCRARAFAAEITRLRAVGPYDGTLRRLLHALKYDGRRTLAKRLGILLEAHAHDVLDGAHLLVPVPLHVSRRRERGFNQATDLASALDLPRVDALARVATTRSQTGLSRDQRVRNVRHAFAVRTRALTSAALCDRVVVLVDDVCTTGATLEACARVLARAGAREVRAVTVARALLHHPQMDTDTHR